MSFLINVGLRQPSDQAAVESSLHLANLTPHASELHGLTLVLEVSANGCFTSIQSCITRLCKVLGREAIAAYHPYMAEGWVYGPGAQAYGPFDLAKFVQLTSEVTA